MSIAIAALGRDFHGSLALLASCKKGVSGARAKVSLHGRSRHRRSCCRRPRYSIQKVTVLSGGIPHRVSRRVDRSCIIGRACHVSCQVACCCCYLLLILARALRTFFCHFLNVFQQLPGITPDTVFLWTGRKERALRVWDAHVVGYSKTRDGGL